MASSIQPPQIGLLGAKSLRPLPSELHRSRPPPPPVPTHRPGRVHKRHRPSSASRTVWDGFLQSSPALEPGSPSSGPTTPTTVSLSPELAFAVGPLPPLLFAAHDQSTLLPSPKKIVPMVFSDPQQFPSVPAPSTGGPYGRQDESGSMPSIGADETLPPLPSYTPAYASSGLGQYGDLAGHHGHYGVGQTYSYSHLVEPADSRGRQAGSISGQLHFAPPPPTEPPLLRYDLSGPFSRHSSFGTPASAPSQPTGPSIGSYYHSPVAHGMYGRSLPAPQPEMMSIPAPIGYSSVGSQSMDSRLNEMSNNSHYAPPSLRDGCVSPAVRVINSRPKPRCWDHGCNGREFSTFSNLLRHQREKSGLAAKSNCPRCGAEFTRPTARNGHMAHDKCRKRAHSKQGHHPLPSASASGSLTGL